MEVGVTPVSTPKGIYGTLGHTIHTLPPNKSAPAPPGRRFQIVVPVFILTTGFCDAGIQSAGEFQPSPQQTGQHMLRFAHTRRESRLRMWLLGLIVIPFSLLEAARPNILFVITDDQSWMHCGAYGDRGIRTPAFDRLAREGVLFQNAHAAAPSCMPSRSAILTGRNIWELEESGNLMGHLPEKFPIFTHRLRDAGYELAATGKTWGPGKLLGYQREDGSPDTQRKYTATSTEALTGKAYEVRKLVERKQGISPVDYASNFSDFLDQRDIKRPFFFWLGTHEPHQGYERGSWKKAGKKLEDALVPGCFPDHPVIRGEFLDYALEVEHADRHLARSIAELEAHGILDQTIIVFTSDHGNPMPRSKCNLYDTGTRVPLAVRWPLKFGTGRSVDDFVNLADLAPTFLEIAGAEVPDSMSARSLAPILQSNRSGQIDESRDFVVTAFERHVITRRGGVGYPMRAIRTGEFAYIRNYEPQRWPAGDPDYYSSNRTFFGDVDSGATKTFLLDHFMDREVHPYYLLSFGRRPTEELYDMKEDPYQLNNLADHADFAEIKKGLMGKMTAFLRATGDPRQLGQAPWDAYRFIDEEIYRHPDWQTRGMATDPQALE